LLLLLLLQAAGAVAGLVPASSGPEDALPLRQARGVTKALSSVERRGAAAGGAGGGAASAAAGATGAAAATGSAAASPGCGGSCCCRTASSSRTLLRSAAFSLCDRVWSRELGDVGG